MALSGGAYNTPTKIDFHLGKEAFTKIHLILGKKLTYGCNIMIF